MAILKFDQITAPDFSGTSSILSNASNALAKAGESALATINSFNKSREDLAEFQLRSQLMRLSPEQYNLAGRTFMTDPNNQDLFRKLSMDTYKNIGKDAFSTKTSLLSEQTNKALRDLTLFKNSTGLKNGGEVLSTKEGEQLWNSFSDEVKANILEKDPSYSILSEGYAPENVNPVDFTYTETIFPKNTNSSTKNNVVSNTTPLDTKDPFALVKREESSNDITSVGKESDGSRSYGLYQFNSKSTLPNFIEWIRDRPDISGEYSDLASILAYPKEYWNTKEGEDTWKRLTKNNSPWKSTLEELSTEYATEQYRDIPLKGLSNESKKLLGTVSLGNQLVTSTAVQHGAGNAIKIINNAAKNSSSSEDFVKNIYSERSKYLQGQPEEIKNNIEARYAREAQEILKQFGNPLDTIATQETSQEPIITKKTISGDQLLLSDNFSSLMDNQAAAILAKQQSNKAELDKATTKLGVNPLSYTATLEANQSKPLDERLKGAMGRILDVLGSKDEDFNTTEVRLKLFEAFQYAMGQGFNPELAEGLILNSLSKHAWAWRSIFGENAYPSKYTEIFSKIDPAKLDTSLRSAASELATSDKNIASSLKLIESLKNRYQTYNRLTRLGAELPAELESRRFMRDLELFNALSRKE